MTLFFCHRSTCMWRGASPIKPLNDPIPITIRPMTITDLDQVIEIDHASFTLPWPQSSFKFEIEKNDASRCWVAVSGSKIVGMIVTWLIVDEVHIATFAVSPTLRRHKIAKRLLAHTLMDAYKQGARKAFLEVRESNLPARELYKKFGFEEAGVRKEYYQDNKEDAVMMNLEKIEIDLLESLL